jgi:hypothetical protein
MKRNDSLKISEPIVRALIGDINIGVKQLTDAINNTKLIPSCNFNNAPEYNEAFDQFTIDLAKVIEKYVETVES